MGLMDILVILDRSGSMADARADHEGGLRSFVRDQKELAGDVRFTLVQFDSHDPCEVIFNRVPIRDVDETKISLLPRGGTPLLDAVGRATTLLIEQQKIVPADETIVMVITDGAENESHEWTRDRVKARVAEMEKGTTKFLYLGANVDAFHEARTLGMAGVQSHAMGYQIGNSQAVNAAYAAVSVNTVRARHLHNSGHGHETVAHAMSFSDDQRAAAAGVSNVGTGTPLPNPTATVTTGEE